MRRTVVYLAMMGLMAGFGKASAQTPETLYTWNDLTTQSWQVWGVNVPGTGTGAATVSAATGDLVVTETGAAGGGVDGGTLWIFDNFDRPRENWFGVKGNTDLTGLAYVEMDVRHNKSATINAQFILVPYINNTAAPQVIGVSIAPGQNTIQFPLSMLTNRQQGNVTNIWFLPLDHSAVGNVTWTISAVRSVGTPLTYRDIVTNEVGTPDEGLDGAFPLNTADMKAIVGNSGLNRDQLGLSRNPAGSGSLQWTDKGGTGEVGSESGASIGWGNGSGWRSSIPGTPTVGNSYWERMSDFSNYDRMTVRISALDAVNPAGTVGIESPFIMSDADGIGTTLASQNLTTDGQYHELVYDLSSISFLKTVQHWGIDVAPHPNNIVFNVDNIRLWNSTTPPGVLGDYNNNGVVDAGDYAKWRKGGALQNESATPGSNTPEDYTYWRSRFGATTGSGTGLSSAVPEPAGAALVLFAIAVCWNGRGVSRRIGL